MKPFYKLKHEYREEETEDVWTKECGWDEETWYKILFMMRKMDGTY